MNSYNIDDIYIGLKETFTKRISDSDIENFYNITNDNNPLHRDREYAKKNGYKDTVVYGFLTASLLSTLAGVFLPGEKSLIHSVEFKCTNPVYINDVLTVIGEVIEKNIEFSFIIVKFVIINRKNEKVLRGKMQVGIRENDE